MTGTSGLSFYLIHISIGMALSALLMAGILWGNSLELGHVLLRSADHPLPLLPFGPFCALTFAPAQLGIAIMLRSEA